MDSHPKKKKKYKANQKSNHGHVVGKDQYSLYSIQSKSKPNPITQHCNTEVFIKKKETKYRAKKKPNTEQTKPQTQSKPNPRWRVAHSVTSVARRRRLVVVAHSPVVVARRLPAVIARRLPVAADRRSVSPSQLLRCSALRYFFLFFSLTLSQSLTLSHTKMKNMK